MSKIRTDAEILLARDTIQIRFRRMRELLDCVGIDSLEERGKILNAILDYGESAGKACGGIEDSNNPSLRAAWISIRLDLDADSKAYIKKSRTNSRNRNGGNRGNERDGGDNRVDTGSGYDNGYDNGYGSDPVRGAEF